MGLDMMIFKKIKDNKPRLLVYWDNANQVRQWFVKHTELTYENKEGSRILLSKEVLVNLVNDCQKVIDDHKLAKSIMPTRGMKGVEFGSTRYGELYYEDLEYTIESVNELLSTLPEDDFANGDIYYYEWW